MKDISKKIKKISKLVEKKLRMKFSSIEISETLECADIDLTTKILRIGIPYLEWSFKHSKCSKEDILLQILVHEALHLKGFNHNYYGYQIGYYSNSKKDRFTPAIIKLIFEEK